MFKGIDQLFNKFKYKNGQQISPKQKYQAVLTAEEILSKPHRQKIIEDFPLQLNLSHGIYESHCAQLISRFAQFTQLLPETRNNYYTDSGGFIDHALERTASALSLCRDYFLTDEAETAILSPTQTQWVYTVFTASLLQGLGKIVTDLTVKLYDHQHQFINDWWPFGGAMTGSHYTYEFTSSNPDEEPLKKHITKLLAQQLMPEEGFQWITENKDIFILWLALLEEDDIIGEGGSFRKILVRADEKTVREWRERQAARTARHFTDAPQEIPGDEHALSQNLETEFKEWLKKQLDVSDKTDAKKYVINATGREAFIANISGLGIVISSDLFSRFMKTQPQFEVFGKALSLAMGRVQFLTAHDIRNNETGAMTRVYALKNQKESLPQKMQVIDKNNQVREVTSKQLNGEQFSSQQFSMVEHSNVPKFRSRL